MIGTGLYLDNLREAEDAIRGTKEEIQNTRDKFLLIALTSLLLSAAGGLVVTLKEARSANKKLRAMAQQVVQSQEVERTRVARELHDGVSQSLASVKFIFESADILLSREKSEAAASTLKQGIAQIIEAMIEVRRISHDLYPTILDDGGLAPALEQMGREFEGRTSIAVTVSAEGLGTIQKEAAKSLYRFAQQALGNIEEHADAKAVKINLRQNKGIFLRIEDDGQGFDVNTILLQRRSGLGITNMRERIEMLGGIFSLRSRPGCTVLRAYLPPESIHCE
jgi:two-component system NarL family sensor kinase